MMKYVLLVGIGFWVALYMLYPDATKVIMAIVVVVILCVAGALSLHDWMHREKKSPHETSERYR